MKRKLIPWRLVIAGLKNEISLENKTLLDQWLAASDNRMLYEELGELWEAIRRETEDCRPDVEFFWTELQSRINTPKKNKRFYMGIKTMTAVAAAIMLIVISTAAFIISNDVKGYSNGKQTYTSFSGKSKVVLPDGSAVWLNKGSTIEYPVFFSKNRSVYLDGEALFDVTKNPKSPFIVYTGGIQVKVYGTQFNVNSYDCDSNVSIALLEGAVSIITDHEETHLIPGEIATFNKTDHILSSKRLSSGTSNASSDGSDDLFNTSNGIITDKLGEELKYESFWASESLTFENKDLGHICKYLEKWYKVNIHLDSSLVKSQHYTFTLRDEPLEQILRNMNKINPINYSFTKVNEVSITKVNQTITR